MKINFILAGALFLSTQLQAQSLPAVSATTLGKQVVQWPQGLPAERTLLLIAFSRSQQPDVDSWVKGLELKAAQAPAWFEVPIINNPGTIGRWFIDNGMRRGIASAEDRAHVVTIYADKKAMMRQMGLSDETKIHAVVVDRKGSIHADIRGVFSLSAAAEIKAKLRH